MMDRRTWILLLAAVIIAVALVYIYLDGGMTGNVVVPTGKSIRIAAFNVQVFGKAKAENETIMGYVARIARQYDVILIQEIRDSDQTVADTMLAYINGMQGPMYGYTISERLGRTSSKEQYAYFFNTEAIAFKEGSAYVFNDSTKDWFEREPYIATFSCKNGPFDFTLIGIHTKPDDATAEIGKLATVVQDVRSTNPKEKDLIVLGDLNADGSYFDENDNGNPLKAQAYRWAITNDMDTMVKTNWTYDRIVLTDSTYGSEYLQGSAGVFYYDTSWGMTDKAMVAAISDHYPIFATFDAMIDDDG